MGKRNRLTLGLGLVAAVAGYALVVRPRMLHWGLREDEARRSMPGDDLVREPMYESTRAITIDAPALCVWQWLVQMGIGRGGFYTYDALENIAGLDIQSADRVRPEWQSLQVGDRINISQVTPLTVKVLEPNRALVLHITMSPFTAEVVAPDDPAVRSYMDWTWAFVLDEITTERTRLVARVRANFKPAALQLLAPLVLEPLHLLMERGMLQGIKRRAESSVT